MSYKSPTFALSTLHIPTTEPFGTMKWAAFIFCLFLVGFAESTPLSRKQRDAGLEDTTSRFATTPPTEFESLALAWFSQYVQQATYNEVEKLVNNVAARSKHCTTHGLPDPRCADSLLTDFLNEICHEQDFAAKYRLTECCAKVHPERDDCFISHKNATPGFLPPFEYDGELICKTPKNVLTAYSIYETARRYPHSEIPAILIVCHEFDKLVPTCCQESDKTACFSEKDGALMKKFEESEFLRQLHCLILKKNGRKALKDFNLAKLSQKYPQAAIPVASTFAELLALASEDCCRSASLQCFRKKVDVADFICERNDTTSTGVVRCLLKFEEDDLKLAGLPPTDKEFIDNQKACQHYAENQTAHLDEFLFEYSKRHPEFSVSHLLRIQERHKTLLEQCCGTENAAGCLAQLDDQVNKNIAEDLEVIKPFCDTWNRGEDAFHNLKLFVFTKRAPQLSFDDLHKHTKQLTADAAKCCPLNDTQLLSCVDRSVGLVLGSLCLQDQTHPINQQFHQCCNGHFYNWRQCFLGLQKVEDYIPDPASHKWPSEDVCSADSGELQLKKQRFLVDLVRHQPDITEDKASDSLTHFSDALEKCCQVENHKECFEKKEQAWKLLFPPSSPLLHGSLLSRDVSP